MILEGYNTPSGTVYQAYKNWAITNGQYVMSGTKFGVEFSKKFDKYKTRGVMVYKNIALKDLGTEGRVENSLKMLNFQ
jgi:poxvirus D5 protein-like